MRVSHVTYFSLLLLTLTESARPLGNGHLQLGAEIIQQRYCEVDDEIIALRLTFRVTLKNIGSPTVVVTTPVEPLILVSRTLDELGKGKHEFEISPAMPEPTVLGTEGRKDDEPPQPTRQAIRQDEVLELVTRERTLPVAKTANYPKSDALDLGTHYLEIVLVPQIDRSTSFVRATSQPIEITVDSNPKIVNCQ